jgi:hypothetical protein
MPSPMRARSLRRARPLNWKPKNLERKLVSIMSGVEAVPLHERRIELELQVDDDPDEQLPDLLGESSGSGPKRRRRSPELYRSKSYAVSQWTT